MVKIAPSTDPANNFEDLINYVKEIENVAHFLHVDVMDSNFVKKTNFDETYVSKINSNTELMLDVHLMVKEPDVQKYIDAGANVVTVHFEAYENKKKLIKTLKKIRETKTLVGLSLKPNTLVEELASFIDYCDIILIMSVEPGSSGQKFLDNTYSRILSLKEMIGNKNVQIEVDGGITPKIASELSKLGVNILVSGSYVYKSKDRVKAIKSLSF